jgi:hypothetical protein
VSRHKSMDTLRGYVHDASVIMPERGCYEGLE